MRKNKPTSALVEPDPADQLPDAGSHKVHQAVVSPPPESGTMAAEAPPNGPESPALAVPSESPELTALLPEVNGLSVDLHRLGKAFLTTALALGQQLDRASAVTGDAGWKDWIAHRTPLSVTEALALVIFAMGRTELAERMSPIASVKIAEILQTAEALAESFQNAQKIMAPEQLT